MNDAFPRLARRQFLGLAGAALTAATVPRSVTAAASAVPATAAAEWRDSLIVNALGALNNPNQHESGSPNPAGQDLQPRERLHFDARTLKDMRASGLTAVNWTIGFVAGPGDPFERSISDIALYDRMIRDESAHVLKVLKADDILRAKREDKVGIIYGFQNASMVGDTLDRVDIFADLGVRIIQLTYNPANQIGDGSMAPGNRGLTPFGREVVARLNDNRIMVDLSHSGEQTCLEAAKVSRQPISINHTGCRALTDLPRNKTDAELRLVAERGGFVGIYFMPFLHAQGKASADDVVAHLEHAIKVCGEDAVGIGTDGDVTQIDDLEAYRGLLAKEIEERRKAGISAKGESPDTLPFVLDLRGPGQFFDLAARLKQRGHSRSRIDKILGNNFLRYARDIWA